MLPPKKHLKPIFCHENMIILYFNLRLLDKNGRKGHKKREKPNHSPLKKTPKTHILS
jgi:hypothetical protein